MLTEMLQRPRRLRRSAAMREMVAQTRLHPSQLMMPYFVVPGSDQREPIAAMPGVDRLSVDQLLRTVEADAKLGVRNLLLFGVLDKDTKDAEGSASYQDDTLVGSAVKALKKAFGDDLLVATDVCLCGYTDHGHCGLLDAGAGAGAKPGEVANDATLPLLARMAVQHAQAGADMVAPSDMMDGRVRALRLALDEAGCDGVALMSYAVKYASAYYGPFRDAAGSAPGQGDRKSYQMDPRNSREARRETLLDVAEGADVVMVKPALAYLDVIAQMRSQVDLPVACYNVSGEYSMVKAAAAVGLVDEGAVVGENLRAMARAGADVLITYHARDALQHGWL